MAEAVEALSPLRLAIADAVGEATNKADARRRVDAVRRKFARDNSIADALYVPAVMADLAGQLMVHEYEAPGVVVKPMAKFALGDAQPLEAFLNLPWDEALAYFRSRGIVREGELETLLKGHAESTKEARKLLLDRVQSRVYELLDTAIEEGDTFRDFAQKLAEDADGLGITNRDPSYLQMVFRTNVHDAYGAGRLAAMNDPYVSEARPFRQIVTAGDGRVRDEHVELDGLVYRADGPLQYLRPPFGYQCRCSIVTLETWDGTVATELPPGALTPGFGGLQ